MPRSAPDAAPVPPAPAYQPLGACAVAGCAAPACVAVRGMRWCLAHAHALAAEGRARLWAGADGAAPPA